MDDDHDVSLNSLRMYLSFSSLRMFFQLNWHPVPSSLLLLLLALLLRLHHEGHGPAVGVVRPVHHIVVLPRRLRLEAVLGAVGVEGLSLQLVQGVHGARDLVLERVVLGGGGEGEVPVAAAAAAAGQPGAVGQRLAVRGEGAAIRGRRERGLRGRESVFRTMG